MERVFAEHERLRTFEEKRRLGLGQLSPLDRVHSLVDEGSFLEIGVLAKSQRPGASDRTPRDGVIAGFGEILGRPVAIVAEDHAVVSESDGAVGKNKRLRVLAHASHSGFPLIYLADGGGDHAHQLLAEEGSLLTPFSHGFTIKPAVHLSKRTWPLITVLFSDSEPADQFLVPESDLIVAVNRAKTDRTISDAVDMTVSSDAEALEAIRRFLSLLSGTSGGASTTELVANFESATSIEDSASSILASCTELATGLVDRDSTVPSLDNGGSSFCAGFGTIGGHPVAFAIGAESGLTRDALMRFHRVALARARLVLPFVLVQHGAAYNPDDLKSPVYAKSVTELVSIIRDCPAPLICVITIKGDALGEFILGGKELGSHYTVAWPSASITNREYDAFTTALPTDGFDDNPWRAAGVGVIDDVVLPSETRSHLARIVPILAPMSRPPHVEDGLRGRILFS